MIPYRAKGLREVALDAKVLMMDVVTAGEEKCRGRG